MFKFFNNIKESNQRQDSVCRIVVNGESFTCSGNSISIINGKIIVDGEEISECSKNVKVIVEGNVNTLKCSGSVDIHGDAGDVNCGGSCSITGNVSGNVSSGGSMSCGKVSGSITAGGSVRCGMF